MTGTVVEFPLQPIDLDRVRLTNDEPCLVLILPVVRIERWDGSVGGGKHGSGRSAKVPPEARSTTDCN